MPGDCGADCEGTGVLSGIGRARTMMEACGVCFLSSFADGTRWKWEGRCRGDRQSCAGRDGGRADHRNLVQDIGIATAARRARLLMGPSCQVVSGMEKDAHSDKDMIRQAALDGGIQVRISDVPLFIWIKIMSVFSGG